MKWMILILLVVGFASAVEMDVDCPDEVFVDEEFECSVEVWDGDGEYDVKVAFDEERNSVGEIWDDDEEKWKSGYYYLKEFVEDGDEEDVKLIISEEGDFDGVLKLRQGDVREFIEFEIEVVEGEEEVIEGEVEEAILIEEKKEVIILGVEEAEIDSEISEVVYESRESFVLRNLSYVFIGILIFIIGILFWEKF